MRIGNVIRSPSRDMWIVTAVHDDNDPPTVSAVAFDAENVSAVQRLDDHERTQTCFCGDNEEDQGASHTDCPDCHGAGRYIIHVKGWKHSKVLANNVREFILNGVKKAWQL